jgi:hypothetical protein
MYYLLYLSLFIYYYLFYFYLFDQFNEAGEVIEPFNLRDERDSGHFDENMNFVFQKEKGEFIYG